MSQLIRPPRQYATDGVRPQTLLFTFFGHHVQTRLGRTPIGTSTLLTLLDQLDVSADAGRSTLGRMVQRGFLDRSRTGRRAYFSITDRLHRLLADGERRLFASPVRDIDPDRWTLLSFSIPEDLRADRHSLRAALGWLGFGPLRDGLWIAPGEVSVAQAVERLELGDRVEVFAARSLAPTDLRRVVAEAWDLDEVAARYREFLARWEGTDPGLSPLALQVLLLTEWRQLLVDDPQLARAHLPPEWPAVRAFEVFRDRLATAQPAAEEELRRILEVRPDWP